MRNCFGAQKEIYEFLRTRKDWLPSGDLERDLSIIRDAVPALLKTVEACGPETLAAEAHDLLETRDEVINEMLINHWLNPSDIQFFAKSFLQPYGRWLADAGGEVPGKEFAGSERRCPFRWLMRLRRHRLIYGHANMAIQRSKSI